MSTTMNSGVTYNTEQDKSGKRKGSSSYWKTISKALSSELDCDYESQSKKKINMQYKPTTGNRKISTTEKTMLTQMTCRGAI